MRVGAHENIHRSTTTDRQADVYVCIQYWTSYPESLGPEVVDKILLLSVSALLLYILEISGLILVSGGLYFEL